MRLLICALCLMAVRPSCSPLATGPGVLRGINAGPPSATAVPEFGEAVTVQVISESSVDADVTVEYFVVDVQVHHSELHVGAFETAHPVGPDLAAIVRINGTYATGQPTPAAVMILGQDFAADDVVPYVIPDPNDRCPGDPDKMSPGICGCGAAETDTDGDATPDCVDLCPYDPGKINPGACGCGVPDTDSDSDGTADCRDGCPNDPEKSDPGVCGCGVSDADTNGNGVPDCNDPPLPRPGPGIIDCNGNGINDAVDVANGTSRDANDNGTPDECEELPPFITHLYQDNGAVRDGAENMNPDGPASIQARTKGITICTIHFSVDVNIQPSDVQIRDADDETDLTFPRTFDYDASAHTLTMTWPEGEGMFQNQWVQIHILDTVTSVADGSALDGEIYAEAGDSSSGLALDGELPSGEATAGGTAMFVIGALEGDVDGNGIVNSFDRLIVNQALGSTEDIPSDVDGNGIVDDEDRLRVDQNQGATLPPLPLP